MYGTVSIQFLFYETMLHVEFPPKKHLKTSKVIGHKHM